MVGSVSVLCGQMLVVGLEGRRLGEAERNAFAAGERGGTVLFRRNVGAGLDGLREVAELIDAVRDAAGTDYPPLVAVDQEGGRVMRLGPPAMQLPPMRKMGDLDDRALVVRVAEAQAKELAALGFTMSFAPIADVHTHADNPIIGDRAFATTPEKVAAFAGAWAEGLARGGILSCATHIPGHGDTTVDSHLALPTVTRPRDQLDRIEIAAFRPLARDPNVASMMTAHVVYPAFDAKLPATLSSAVCTDLLRRELGFEGVLFSDDLEMKAIEIPVGEAAVRAVLAGCDVLLVCSRPDLVDEAFAGLVHEAEKSAAFRARCEEAVARHLTMRRKVRPAPTTDAAALERVFAATAPVADELAARLASHAESTRA